MLYNKLYNSNHHIMHENKVNIYNCYRNQILDFLF